MSILVTGGAGFIGFFQKKCSEKIDEIRKAGKTIILVSRSLGTVRSLCSCCRFMKGGKGVVPGETKRCAGGVR